jgi:hypothetical protein
VQNALNILSCCIQPYRSIATKEDNTIRWWRERRTDKGQNVTTTVGLRIENNTPLQYEHPRKGSKYIVWTSGRRPSEVQKEYYKILRKKKNKS